MRAIRVVLFLSLFILFYKLTFAAQSHAATIGWFVCTMFAFGMCGRAAFVPDRRVRSRSHVKSSATVLMNF